jgi:hypothetical protein
MYFSQEITSTKSLFNTTLNQFIESYASKAIKSYSWHNCNCPVRLRGMLWSMESLCWQWCAQIVVNIANIQRSRSKHFYNIKCCVRILYFHSSAGMTVDLCIGSSQCLVTDQLAFIRQFYEWLVKFLFLYCKTYNQLGCESYNTKIKIIINPAHELWLGMFFCITFVFKMKFMFRKNV